MDTSWNVTIKTSSLPAYCQVIVVYDDLQFHRFATVGGKCNYSLHSSLWDDPIRPCDMFHSECFKHQLDRDTVLPLKNIIPNSSECMNIHLQGRRKIVSRTSFEHRIFPAKNWALTLTGTIPVAFFQALSMAWKQIPSPFDGFLWPCLGMWGCGLCEWQMDGWIVEFCAFPLSWPITFSSHLGNLIIFILRRLGGTWRRPGWSSIWREDFLNWT